MPWASTEVTITARVRSLVNTHVWAKAGVMIREDLTPGSRHVMTVVTPGKGVSLQWRPAPNASSQLAPNAAGVAPGWVRLSRTGDNFTSSWSTDGEHWTTVGSVTVRFGTSGVLYVGLPVSSHNPGATTTAVFDDVMVREVSFCPLAAAATARTAAVGGATPRPNG